MIARFLQLAHAIFRPEPTAEATRTGKGTFSPINTPPSSTRRIFCIRLALLLCCSASLLMLFCCSPGATSPSNAALTHGTVVIGWSDQPRGVNELIAQPSAPLQELRNQFFLPLLLEQPDFDQEHPPTMAPLLARSYEWSQDHRVLTFHLRDARWSDGVPVTSEDVRWTWQAQVNPKVAWSESSTKDDITDVEATETHTVRFHFRRAYAKQLMDANTGGILPKHVWSQLPFDKWRESGDWFRTHLIVDGPFKIKAWVPQQEIVLERNDLYFDQPRPYLDKVVLRTIPSTNSLRVQLANGEVDVAFSVSPAEAKEFINKPQLTILPYWFRTWVALIWNNSRPLFHDPEVRRALTLAIDRESIVNTLLSSYGRVSYSPILRKVWGNDRTLEPWPYKPGEARTILAAKGWSADAPEGALRDHGVPFAFDLETNNNPLRSDAAVMIQAQLKLLGIEARPRVQDFNALSTRLSRGDFDAAIMGMAMDTGLDLRAQFHSRSIGSTNLARYSNPIVDLEIEQAAAQVNLLQVKPYLVKIQKILHKEQPCTFLWESQRVSVYNRRVHDFKPNMAFTLLNLSDWWVEPPP